MKPGQTSADTCVTCRWCNEDQDGPHCREMDLKRTPQDQYPCWEPKQKGGAQK